MTKAKFPHRPFEHLQLEELSRKIAMNPSLRLKVICYTKGLKNFVAVKPYIIGEEIYHLNKEEFEVGYLVANRGDPMYIIAWWHYRYSRFYDRLFTPKQTGKGLVNVFEVIIESINARADAIRERFAEEKKKADEAKSKWEKLKKYE